MSSNEKKPKAKRVKKEPSPQEVLDKATAEKQEDEQLLAEIKVALTMLAGPSFANIREFLEEQQEDIAEDMKDYDELITNAKAALSSSQN